MDIVSGEILTAEGFEKGYISFNKENFEMSKGLPQKKPICEGLIVPTFVNSHTHIGDSFIRDKNIVLPKNVEELVAPPDGLKHRLLRESSDEEIIEGMEHSLDLMIKSGTQLFCDFRENGILGISQLKSALRLRKISSVILSRPDSLKYDKIEIDLLLKSSDGIAISSISDWGYSELQKVAKSVKKDKKIFALHASERIRENIDDILDLKPDFLVHMIKASESDLIRVCENNIPVIICPRANSFFGLEPNFELLKKVNINLLIGTDNAMLNTPIILDEINYIRSISNVYSIHELLYMATFGARKALNLKGHIQGLNSKGNFVVLEKKSLKPLYISLNNLEELK